jgi:DNA-binding response OmpR family regulator
MNSLLLIDDEEAICTQFGRTLESFGYRVEMAHTLESALNCAEQVQFDAILVEFNLRSGRRAHPRAGNGLQLVRQLRVVDVEAPVIIFTAMEDELYETASLDAGADDFILKTSSIPSLVSRLRAHIRRHNKESSKRTESNEGSCRR